MKRILMTTAAMAATAGLAQAGGVERAFSPYAILWEKGNYAELSFGNVSPNVSGSVGGGAVVSGDMAGDYNQFGLGVKYALTEQLDLAVVLDQPMGADVDYPAGTGYPLAGSNAEVDSTALTGMLRYKFNDAFSVHGGVKIQRSKGNVALSLPGGAPVDYMMSTSTETDVGYLLGVAYERPEIALRVALTYQSAITHAFEAVETIPGFGTFNTAFETEVPQQVTLDFQSGVAEDTLVFGSIRWREWTAFDITPTMYTTAVAPGTALVDYDDDVVTWTLGVGRRFNENWAGSIALGYEKSNGTPTGNLGPHDGMKSVTIGVAYTQDNLRISGGVSYVKIGDATTNPPINGNFTDNEAIGVGIKVGYSF